MMENKFTQKAQRAIALSEGCAHDTDCNYIGTEHLLYGLMEEGSGFAAKYLNEIGIDKAEVRKRIEKFNAGANQGAHFAGFTPRTSRCLQNSMAEAHKYQSGYIGTEHILLALARERDGVAFKILIELGAPTNLYEDIAAKLQDANPESEKPQNKKGGDTPTLNQFGRDLTSLAKAGKFDPVIGR